MSNTDRSIADQIVEGACCSLCCNTFIDGFEHGYPVVCNDCWKDLTRSERKMYQKATKNSSE
jgi:hypothetical protein